MFKTLTYLIYIFLAVIIAGCNIFAPKEDKGFISPCACASAKTNKNFAQNISR